MKKYLLTGAVAFTAFILVGQGCVEASSSSQSTYQNDTQKVEDTQKDLQQSTPIPTLSRSVERENIARRAETFDVQNKVSYIYLVSYGKVMANYTVDGKVSSLNSYLAPMEKLVNSNGSPCSLKNTYGYDGGADPCYTVSSPDIDGAYGENTDGIFFFTTDGVYVEWKGEYMMSDEALQLSTPPALVRTVN